MRSVIESGICGNANILFAPGSRKFSAAKSKRSCHPRSTASRRLTAAATASSQPPR